MSKPTRHTSEMRAFRVEVRSPNKPIIYADGNFTDTEWRLMPIRSVPPEIATAADDTQDKLTRTHSYHGAIALAASWLDAHRRTHFGCEARLVEFKRVVSYELVEVSKKDFPTEVDEFFAQAGLSERLTKGDEDVTV